MGRKLIGAECDSPMEPDPGLFRIWGWGMGSWNKHEAYYVAQAGLKFMSDLLATGSEVLGLGIHHHAQPGHTPYPRES